MGKKNKHAKRSEGKSKRDGVPALGRSVWLAGLGALATDAKHAHFDELAARGEAVLAPSLAHADAAQRADFDALAERLRRLAAALGDDELATATFRVTRDATGWTLARDGRAGTPFRTRKEALGAGRRIARAAAPSVLVVHGEDGQPLETIRYRG